MSFQDQVDREIERLRCAGSEDLARLSAEQAEKRLCWLEENRDRLRLDLSDLLTAGYELLLARLGIRPEDAPIVERTNDRIVFRSTNPCPTLAACARLGLDTRRVCRAISEPSTDALLRALHPDLRFARNYESLRPYAGYCEEMILLERPAAGS